MSADCADLLTRLLQHDPQQRLSYEQLFAHPFLDLEHLPSEDSYKKAVGLVHDAVKQDAAKEFKQAFMLYCQALQYFVPYIEGACYGVTPQMILTCLLPVGNAEK